MRRHSAELDGLDAKIILMLQSDGRLPNTTIARRLGVAEGTVRKRVARLLRERVMQFGALADPLKIGYQIYVNLEIQAEPRLIEQVAERVARLDEVFFLGISTGPFDMIGAAAFRSNEHFYEFMTQRLARIPGIQRTLTAGIVRTVKRKYTPPVPTPGAGDGVTGGAPRRRAPRPGQRAAGRRGANTAGLSPG